MFGILITWYSTSVIFGSGRAHDDLWDVYWVCHDMTSLVPVPLFSGEKCPVLVKIVISAI